MRMVVATGIQPVTIVLNRDMRYVTTARKTKNEWSYKDNCFPLSYATIQQTRSPTSSLPNLCPSCTRDCFVQAVLFN